MRKRYYRNKDPYWIKSTKWPGTCKTCKETINPGHKAYYRPAGREIFCEKCGEDQERDFNAHAFDEEVYNYNPYL